MFMSYLQNQWQIQFLIIPEQTIFFQPGMISNQTCHKSLQLILAFYYLSYLNLLKIRASKQWEFLCRKRIYWAHQFIFFIYRYIQMIQKTYVKFYGLYQNIEILKILSSVNFYKMIIHQQMKSFRQIKLLEQQNSNRQMVYQKRTFCIFDKFQYSNFQFFNINIIPIMIQAEQNSSAEDNESEESVNLTNLRKKLELSNIQLLQLTYNDEKFMAAINDYNMNGIERLNNEEYKEALLYFNENQKILEYSASCGKTIDRSVIISTLHNEACVHQKLWDLQKSANYLQAIIYNINFYLEGMGQKKIQFLNCKTREQSEIASLTGLIHKTESYALYHLQFCAVNSQIRKHHISVESAQNSIKILKQTCSLTSMMINVDSNSEEPSSKDSNQKSKQILYQLASLEQKLSIENYESYLKKVKMLMIDKITRSYYLQQQFSYLKSFSIGKLMQLTPITISDLEAQPSFDEWIQLDNTLIKALYLGVSYFTVGTQLRFISSQNCEEGGQQNRNSHEFRISQVYHLYAILIVLTYVPIDTIFLNHLVTSFNNHYQLDLQKLALTSHITSQSKQQSLITQKVHQKQNPKTIVGNFNQQHQIHTNGLPEESQIRNNFYNQQRPLLIQSIQSKRQLKQKAHFITSTTTNAPNNNNNNSSNENLRPSKSKSNIKQPKNKKFRTQVNGQSEVSQNQLKQNSSRMKAKESMQKIMVIKKSEKLVRRQEKIHINRDYTSQSKSPGSKVTRNKLKSKSTLKDNIRNDFKRLSFRELHQTSQQNRLKSKGKSKQDNHKNFMIEPKSKKSKNMSKSHGKSKKNCIYTTKNNLDLSPLAQQTKERKHKKFSKSKQKSTSRKKILKSREKLASLSQIPQKMMTQANDYQNSPKEDMEDLLIDRAKMVQSKVDEDVLVQSLNNMNPSKSNRNPQKSKSKPKKKDKIKMNKVANSKINIHNKD